MNGSVGSSNPPGTGGGVAQGNGVTGDSIVLEEEIDPNYVPTQAEVREYAKWLGMELEDDRDLFWIAKEGLKAPLPENWKPCKTVDTDEIYYFNFATGESTWDHPCDEYYRKLYEEEKKKKMTKDKAKHDKSKQQAKKDVNQLLGKDKKKRGRPTGKRGTHQPSPERIQAVSSPAPSIFDRKPLPGIGRQPLQGGDTLARQRSVSSSPQPEKAAPLADRSPSRTQPSSLVGHRLSQHLSVSVDSEEGDPESEDHKSGEPVVKSSVGRAPSRSREEDSLTHGTVAGTIGSKSDHTTALKDLRMKHAQELDRLEQAHSRTKHELEDDHRRRIGSETRQWAAAAEVQTKKAREALKRDLEKARTNHSREIDELERSLLDSKARLQEAAAETEKAREAAEVERRDLEATLADYGRRIVGEKALLREAQEASRKVQSAVVFQAENGLSAELTRTTLELQNEREHVAELERQLKEANNGTGGPSLEIEGDSSEAAALRAEKEDSAVAKIAALEDNLTLALRENEHLRKEQAQGETASVGRPSGGGYAVTSETEARKLEQNEVIDLKRALQEAEVKLIALEQAKNLADEDAKRTTAALVVLQETHAGVELDNTRLVEQVARYRQRATSDMAFVEQGSSQDGLTETRMVIAEREADAFNKTQEMEKLREKLETARSEVARSTEELHKSRDLEAVVRNELQAAHLALHDSQIEVAELRGVLTTADHEKELNAATVEQLKQEGARLKEHLEQMSSIAEGSSSREVTDALVSEVKALRTQLETLATERDNLNDEVGTLKHQRVSAEGVQRAERAMFTTNLASLQRQVESLKSTVERLESIVSEGKQTEEAHQVVAKSLREQITASNREVQILKEKLGQATAQAERATADLVSIKERANDACQKEESAEATVSSADLERAVAATDEAVREARELFAEKSAMATRLELAEGQVDRLKSSLQETVSKLADAQSSSASAQLSSERAASNTVSEEELAKAYRTEKDAVQRLAEANSRCADAEERLAKAGVDRDMLENTLRDAARKQDVQDTELRSVQERLRALLEKESRDASSQTVIDKRCSDLEGKLLQSQRDLQLASADLTSTKRQAARLEQELADSTVRAREATDEARRNEELASARQEEIMSVSEREGRIQRELDQTCVSLSRAAKDRAQALAAVDEAKVHLADGERRWRRERDDLMTSLDGGLARTSSKEQSSEFLPKNGGKEQQRPTASAPGNATPREPQAAVIGDTAAANDVHQSSRSGVSDASSQGLAEELMQKLTEVTSRRRSARKASGDKVPRSWAKKLDAEKRMLELAKQVVRHHKERARKRQQHLLRRQTQWRDQRQQSEFPPPTKGRRRRSTRHRSLDNAKRELDSEVHELNRFVKQLRSSKSWLDKRERKISEFEALLDADASGFQSSPEQDAASLGSSGPPYSSPESSSITDKIRSLEAMQQDLDNDVSEVSGGSSYRSAAHPPDIDVHRKATRSQGFVPKQGKENIFPGSMPMFAMGYSPFSQFPTSSGFWGHTPHPYFGEHPTPREEIPFGSRARRRQRPREHMAYHREDGHYGSRAPTKEFAMENAPETSESELQDWLNRPELDARKNVDSGVASRQRTEHIARLAVEGRQAHSTVALHVDWLNTLRQEMGLLGFPSTKHSNVEDIPGISTAVDALTSPRRVMKASLRGIRRTQEV